VTFQPARRPTSQPTKRVHQQTQHHHDITAQTSYQPTPQIKNSTADPCITIRRPGTSRKPGTTVLILGSIKFDLERGTRAC